jgi:hypothetical protein
MTKKQVQAAAKRMSALDDNDTLFRAFYDALPKTSAAFSQLTADVALLAAWAQQTAGKETK